MKPLRYAFVSPVSWTKAAVYLYGNEACKLCLHDVGLIEFSMSDVGVATY